MANQQQQQGSAAPAPAPTAAPKATHAYSFGAPLFSLPDRPIKTKDGKSQMVVRIKCDILGTGLCIESGIWAREFEDRDAGTINTVFSVSLPRGLRPVDNDGTVAATIERWQQTVLDAYDKWSASANAQTPSYTGAPRLVRTRPLAAKPATA